METFMKTSLLSMCALIVTLGASVATAQLRPPAGMTPAAPPAAPPAAAPQAAPSAPPPQDPLTREFRACIQKAQAGKPDDPAPAIACINGEVKRQEGRVTANIARVSKSITPEGKKRMDEAQVAWRRFRDANCLMYADPKGPPQAAGLHAECMLNLTVGRVIEIDRIGLMVAQQQDAARAAGTPPAASAPAAPPTAAPAEAPAAGGEAKK